MHVHRVNAEQALHEAPAFAWHARHVVAAVAAVVVEYVPAAQLVQLTLPVAVVYCPAAHARQVSAAVAPTVVEYVPIPQLVHARVSVVILYFPAMQVVHGPPLGLSYPALQLTGTKQASLDVLPTDEVLPAGHVPHADEPGHAVSVRSIPFDIIVDISIAAVRLINSSTTNIPAISPFHSVPSVTALPA